MVALDLKFDFDIQDGARVATPEEAEEIKVSTGFTSNESVLNDGQLVNRCCLSVILC